jgi:hypothetical protein
LVTSVDPTEARNAENQMAVGMAVLSARLDKVNRRAPMESVHQLLGSSCVQKLPEAVDGDFLAIHHARAPFAKA